MVIDTRNPIFHLDSLAMIMITLVAFIGLCVGSFAYRYLKGDTQYRAFFGQLGLMVLSVMVMASADHLAVLLAAWCLSNLFLVRLMIHKPGWKAAENAGMLAAKHYAVGALSLAAAFGILYQVTDETSIQTLVHHRQNSRSFSLHFACC